MTRAERKKLTEMAQTWRYWQRQYEQVERQAKSKAEKHRALNAQNIYHACASDLENILKK